MKRPVIFFIIATLIIITIGMWMYSSNVYLNKVDILSFGVILILIAFSLFIAYKKFSNTRRGEPTEDELSKKVLQKTASLSYYISIYLWLVMIYITDKVNLDTEEILVIGILGMAITYAVCWMIFNFRGVRNE